MTITTMISIAPPPSPPPMYSHLWSFGRGLAKKEMNIKGEIKLVCFLFSKNTVQAYELISFLNDTKTSDQCNIRLYHIDLLRI